MYERDPAALAMLTEDPPAPKWPTLDPAARYGVLGDWLALIEPHTEADPAALLVQALVAAGNAIGRGPTFAVGGVSHHTNDYALVVGNTGSGGRKGQAWGEVKALLTTAAPEYVQRNIVSGLGASGEGLIWHVRDPVTERQPIKERGRVVDYQNVVTDHGQPDKRALITETEFVGVLRRMRREGNSVSAVIRDAWDDGTLATLTKTPYRASNAHVSIIGHITRRELTRHLDATDLGNGFANRFLFVAARRARSLPHGDGISLDAMRPIAGRLLSALMVAEGIDAMHRSAEAAAAWEDVYDDLATRPAGLWGELTSRAEAHALRLSMIYAALDGSAVIRREHHDAALAVWRFCEASAALVFPPDTATGDRDKDKVLAAIRQAEPGGLDRTAVHAALGRHRSKEQVDGCLRELTTDGRIVPEPRSTGGRPATFYRLTELAA